jgi:drug/metabolite transporter (DMT)-like permease
MVAAVLAISAAGLIGTADFGVGLAARNRGLLASLVGPQLTATVVLVAAAALVSQPNLTDPGLVLAIAACRALALVSLTQALTVGPVSIVSPITGMNGLVPLAVGLALGERLRGPQQLGIFLCLVGLVLVTRTSAGTDERNRRRIGVAYALVALGAMGGETTLIGIYAHHVEPIAAAANIQLVSLLFLAPVIAIQLARSSDISASLSSSLLWSRALLLVGLTQAAGTGLYAAALRVGQLSTVGVLLSIYPAATVLLARVVLNERLGRRHALGAMVMLLGIIGVAS